MTFKFSLTFYKPHQDILSNGINYGDNLQFRPKNLTITLQIETSCPHKHRKDESQEASSAIWYNMLFYIKKRNA